MKPIPRSILSLGVAAILVAIPTLSAAAKELTSFTISGPGIQGSLTIEDAEGLTTLEQTGFFFDDFAYAQPPEGLGEGYAITAYINIGQVVPFVEMVYYPPAEGESGFVHYTGRLGADAAKLVPVDQWRSVPAASATAFRAMVNAHGIELQTAVVSEATELKGSGVAAKSSPSTSPSATYGSIVVGILALAAIGVLVMRRRTLNRKAAPAD